MRFNLNTIFYMQYRSEEISPWKGTVCDPKAKALSSGSIESQQTLLALRVIRVAQAKAPAPPSSHHP